jgi:hypothetical protein
MARYTMTAVALLCLGFAAALPSTTSAQQTLIGCRKTDGTIFINDRLRGMYAEDPMQNMCGPAGCSGCLLITTGTTGPRLSCTSIWAASTDQWCNDSCNHVPAFCPDTHCKCTPQTPPSPVAASTTRGTTWSTETLENFEVLEPVSTTTEAPTTTVAATTTTVAATEAPTTATMLPVDDNEKADRICKGTCAMLKRNCNTGLLVCGSDTVNVAELCPVTCSAATEAPTTVAATEAPPTTVIFPYDAVNCPFNARVPATCWGNSAYQICSADRQGAYDAVMRFQGSMEEMYLAYQRLITSSSCRPTVAATTTVAPTPAATTAKPCAGGDIGEQQQKALAAMELTAKSIMATATALVNSIKEVDAETASMERELANIEAQLKEKNC